MPLREGATLALGVENALNTYPEANPYTSLTVGSRYGQFSLAARAPSASRRRHLAGGGRHHHETTALLGRGQTRLYERTEHPNLALNPGRPFQRLFEDHAGDLQLRCLGRLPGRRQLRAELRKTELNVMQVVEQVVAELHLHGYSTPVVQ